VLAEQAGDRIDERESLATIEHAARQALHELRQILGVLRHDAEPHALSPQPGLHQLDELLEEVRRNGLPVTLSVAGAPATLPPAIDLSAYRIVQEALTNVIKHEGAVPTTVVVRHRPSDLEIEVTNEGPTRDHTPATGHGHGIVGMRERVTLFGGELDTHYRPDGGFAVVARIPLSRTAL
jgi:signal transduction histidine kinase